MDDRVGVQGRGTRIYVQLSVSRARRPCDDDTVIRANLMASIYISGDTLMVPELKEIPRRYSGQNIDLMLVHLGGTTIPSPSLPLLMVTMDATQGLELVRLINPDLTIPIHYE